MAPLLVAAALCGPSAVRAAAPQQVASLQVETNSLASVPATAPDMATGTPAALVTQAHAQVLRPAPLPDQDVDAPGPSAEAIADEQQASFQPSFYGPPKQSFSGDGFASGSSLNSDSASRRRPAGGMSLSIPVQ